MRRRKGFAVRLRGPARGATRAASRGRAPAAPTRRAVELGQDRLGQVGATTQREVPFGDVAIGFGQRHLDVVEHRREQRPLVVRRPQHRDVADRFEPTAQPVPTRQRRAGLRPREHPRNRAQVGQPATRRASRRPRADAQRTDLGEWADRGEELGEPVGADQLAVGRAGRIAHLLERAPVLRRRSGHHSSTAGVEANMTAAATWSRWRCAITGWP